MATNAIPVRMEYDDNGRSEIRLLAADLFEDRRTLHRALCHAFKLSDVRARFDLSGTWATVAQHRGTSGRVDGFVFIDRKKIGKIMVMAENQRFRDIDPEDVRAREQLGRDRA